MQQCSTNQSHHWFILRQHPLYNPQFLLKITSVKRTKQIIWLKLLAKTYLQMAHKSLICASFGYSDQENTKPEQERNDDAQKMIEQIFLSNLFMYYIYLFIQ